MKMDVIEKDNREKKKLGWRRENSFGYLNNLLNTKNERKKPRKKRHEKNVQEEIKKLVKFKGEVMDENIQKLPCRIKHNEECGHSKRNKKIKLMI